MDLYTTKSDRKWYEIWIDVLIHPGVAAFQRLLQEVNIDPKRGYIWVAVTTIISYFISALLTTNLYPAIDRLENTISLMTSICYLVIGPVVAVVGLIITASLFDWIARRFGGTGNWNRLAFCLAAIQAPLSLISVLFSLLVMPSYTQMINNSIAAESSEFMTMTPFFWMVSLASMAVGIYSIVLYINAIRAVENIDAGKATLTYFIPVIFILVIGIGCVCLTTLLATSQGVLEGLQ